jgi:AraC-like DNA-binding protein
MQFFRLRETLVHGDAGFPLHVYDLANQASFVFPCHWHPEWEIILVTEGSLELQVGERQLEIGRGQAAFVGPATLHAGHGGQAGCRCRAVVFNPCLLDPAMPDKASARWLVPLGHGELALPARIAADEPGAPAVLEALDGLIRAADRDDPGRELVIRGKLLQILGALANAGRLQPGGASASIAASREDARLRTVLAHIEQHLDRPFTLDGLAALACLSRSAFSRFFKAQTGESAVEYINRCRVVRAAALIRQSGWPVSAAASAAGFDNLSYFSRTFRRYLGVCPSAYRV